MVRLSPTANDRTMLREQVELLGLSPSPSPDFWRESGWMYRSARYRRHVEPYSWGVFVSVAERPEPYRGFSAVCVGKHNLNTGETVGPDGATHSLAWDFPWYAKVLEEIATSAPAIPPCTGKHKPLAVLCDGGTFGHGGYLEPPCAWREACDRLKTWCAANKHPVARVLEGKTPESLMAFIELLPPSALPPVELGAAMDLVMGRARSLVPQRAASVPLGEATISSLRAMGLAVRQQYLIDYVRQIMEAVIFRAGRRLAPSGAEAAVGDCYIVIRENTDGEKRSFKNNYVALYSMPPRKQPVARTRIPKGSRHGVGIMRITTMPLAMALDVEIGASDLCPPIVKSFGRRMLPAKWCAGAFPSRVRIDATHDVPVLIEVVSQLIQQGHIRLPQSTGAAA